MNIIRVISFTLASELPKNQVGKDLHILKNLYSTFDSTVFKFSLYSQFNYNLAIFCCPTLQR